MAKVDTKTVVEKDSVKVWKELEKVTREINDKVSDLRTSIQAAGEAGYCVQVILPAFESIEVKENWQEPNVTVTAEYSI